MHGYVRDVLGWLIVLSPAVVAFVAWNVADIIRTRHERAKAKQRGFAVTRQS
jgi:hypothetical protein